MQVKFLGGVGEYARTCILLVGEKQTILLDCGVDKSEETIKEQYPLLTEEIASSIDLVLLSHSHQDHSCALPYLYALGYRGKVLCSEQTKQQVPSYIASWVAMNQQKNRPLPFTKKDVESIQWLTFSEASGEQIFSENDLLVKWGSSGHILGSVWYDLVFEGTRIFFSGDYHTDSSLYSFKSPQNKNRELAILDSAYGIDRMTQGQRIRRFTTYMQQAMEKRENILLPLPKYGRSQEVVFLLGNILSNYQLILEKDILFPLEKMKSEKNWVEPIDFNPTLEKALIVDDTKSRKEALSQSLPKVIVTPDGMLDSERAKFYFEALKKEGYFHLLFTGHVAQNTFGYEVLNTSSPLYNAQKLKVNVHPTLHETRAMLEKLRAKQVVLTHNAKEANDQVVEYLAEEHDAIHSLKTGDNLDLHE